MKKELQLQLRKVAEYIAGIAIVILLPIVLYQGVVVFMPEPANVQKAHEQIRQLERERIRAKDTRIKEIRQDIDELQREAVEPFLKERNKVIFMTFLIAGIILIALGLIMKVTVLGSIFAIGGALSVIIAYARYWAYLTNMVIFLTLVVSLIVLIAAIWWQSKKK